MKKIPIILSLLMCFAFAKGQAITDGENTIKVSYADGSVFSVKKDLYNVEMDEDSTFVSIVSAQATGKRDHKAYLVLDPTDFGYASASLLFNFLYTLINREYYSTFINVSGTTQIDTAKYWHITATDTTATLLINYDYTGASSDTLASKTIIPQ